MKTMGIRCLMAMLVVASFMAAGCGGSSSDSDSSTSSDLTITSTVLIPTIGTSSISKAVTEAAGSGLTGTLYNLDGDTIGTCTTDASGVCSIEGTFEDVKPSDATAAAYDAEFLLIVENEAGTIHVETYVEPTIDESSTTTVDLGTANTDTTLAARAMFKNVGCVPGSDCKALFANMDTECFFKAQKKMWGSGAIGGNGLKDGIGLIKELPAAGMAAGIAPSELGDYADWPAVMDAIFDGTLPSTALQTLADAAETATGADSDTIVAGYAGSYPSFGVMNNIFGTQLAGGEGLVGVASLAAGISKAATVEAGSACANITDDTIGADYSGGYIELFLACDSATECASTFADDDCFKATIGIMDKYKTAEDYDSVASKAPIMQEYIANAGGCDDMYSGGAFDDNAFGAMKEIFDMADGSKNFDDMKKWAKAMEGMVENMEGGYGAMFTGGEFNSDTWSFYNGYFDGQLEGGTFNPDQINFGALEGQLYGQFQGMDPKMQGEMGNCWANGGTFLECAGVPPPDPGDYEFQEDQIPMNTYGQTGFPCFGNTDCNSMICSVGLCT